MRKLFALVGIVALFAVSCEFDGTTDTPGENVASEILINSEGVITLPAVGGDVELDYEIVNPVEGVSMEATADVEWITDLSVAEKISFSVEQNDSVNRIGVLTFTYGDVVTSIAVQQTAFMEEGVSRISVTSDLEVIVAAEGGSGKISYLLECEEKGAMPTVEADVDWIVVDSVEAKRVKYTVLANTVEEIRVGYVTLSYEEVTAQVAIKQEAAKFEPVLTASNVAVKLNESVEFKVMYGDKDVTAEAQILEYYTNENIGSTYVAKVLGEHYFYAKYNNRESRVLSIYVSPENAPEFPEDTNPMSFSFNQRFLLVDHTGLGCSYCPYMKSAIKEAEESEYYENKFNVVYAYSYSASEVCYTKSSDILWDYYKSICRSLTGFPSATFNYQYNQNSSFNDLTSHIKSVWDSNPSASVALAVKLEDNQLIASVAVKSSKAQNIKLSLWVLEDDINARQTNAYEDWHNNHHNVLRECPTGVSAKDIAGVELGDVEANGVLRKVVGYNLNPASSWVVDNYKVIAIISAPSSEYGNKYEVVNTAICEIGGSVGFDYK